MLGDHEYIRQFVAPDSIVIIGASGNPGTISGRPLTVLQQHDYQGQVYLVNPIRDQINGIACYHSVAELPEVPDLALIVVGASLVLTAIQECKQRGITAAYVISSGFSESGNETAGPQMHAELQEIVADKQIRIAGPNAEGVYNIKDDIAIGFSPTIDYTRGLQSRPAPGNVAVVSQSGGLGFGIFNQGLSRDIDFSYVISTGNEADVSVLDYVDYLIGDPDTKVIALFLEGVESPEELEELALRAHECGKTIVAAKVGRSPEAQLAAISHTGHMTGPSELYSALFERCGIIEVLDLEEMLDAVAVLSKFGESEGANLGVVTGSGGAGAWLTDICRARGIDLPPLSAVAQEKILAKLPYYATARNPVDMTAGERSAQIAADILTIVAATPEIDILVLVQSMLTEGRSVEVADAVGKVLPELGKPVLAYSYTTPAREASRAFTHNGVPWFTSQRGIANGIMTLVKRGANMRRLDEPGVTDRIRSSRRPATPRDLWPTRQSESVSIPEYAVKEWLQDDGLPIPAGTLVVDAASAVRAAEEIGFPVALKAQSSLLPHKLDADVIALNLRTAHAVEDQYDAIHHRAVAHAGAEQVDGILIESMAGDGYELLIGVVVDDLLGAFLTVGAGGSNAEFDHDIAILPAECSPSDVERALRKLRCWNALCKPGGGYRYDVDAFCGLAARVSELANASRVRLRELDLNPVRLHPGSGGVTIVDALAATWPARKP